MNIHQYQLEESHSQLSVHVMIESLLTQEVTPAQLEPTFKPLQLRPCTRMYKASVACSG